MEEQQQRPMKVYGRCCLNFAMDAVGSYVTDGCEEYVQDEERPGEYRCKGCGCHRNYHEKVLLPAGSAGAGGDASALSNLLAGGGGGGGNHQRSENPLMAVPPERTRTRFSDEQRRRMTQFAESRGWKMGRTANEYQTASSFCEEIGISRHSLQIWMQNHKNDPQAP